MQLSLQNFTTLVQNMAASVQSTASQLVDLTVGSVLRAILEASASVALWLQWLIVQVLSMTRAATSVGTDLDSWMADFSVTRLPAVAATGSVTLARLSTGTAALVVPGANVKAGGGTQVFLVTTDTNNSAWSASLGGYVIPIGTVSITVPVQAAVAGSAGNVSAGAISLLATAIPGVDTVTNAVAFTNGIDAETDVALRARFVNYITSLSKGTRAAIASAIAGVQQGLTYSLAANVDEIGDYDPGHFVVTIDDGTGAPSETLKDTVYLAVDAVRAFCETFSVQSPGVIDVAVALTITVATGTVKANLIGPVGLAITAYVNALPIGVTLPYSRIAQIAYGVDPGITNVSAVTVNGATADIAPGASGVVKLASVTVS